MNKYVERGVKQMWWGMRGMEEKSGEGRETGLATLPAVDEGLVTSEKRKI